MDTPGTLYLQVADTVAALIRNGTLARGDRLPSVREAARRHGVSVATAVQAYHWLEDARLVEARPRSGYFVAAQRPQLPQPRPSRPPAASRAVDVGSIAQHVLHLAHDPEILSFGAACPDRAMFDGERIRRTVNRVVQRHRDLLTHYPIGPGQALLRRAIARHAAGMGCTLDAQRIVITNGCLEAITLALRAVTQPGDVVALESPTYFGFLEILQNLHLRALEIPTHPRTGLSVDALALALQTQPVRAVLSIPTLANPLGACMPLPERRRLARLLAHHEVPLIEDVIYNDLAEQDDARRAVKAFDREGYVMLCGSFTKTLAPGIRLGWIEPGRWHERVLRLKTATSGGQTAVLEEALADLLNQPGHGPAQRRLRSLIAVRVDEARQIIARHFPRGTRVTDPPGGFILWVELPPAVDARELFEACLAENICVAPGHLFSATPRYHHHLRLGVGGRWDEVQKRALARVGEIAGRMATRAPGPGQDMVASTPPPVPSRRDTAATS